MKNSIKKSSLTRRQFINRAAIGTAAIAVTPFNTVFAQSPTWPCNAGEVTFYMIGHAHIDPVWLWPWTEGVSITHSTFQSALDRMNEDPNFCFISKFGPVLPLGG